MPKAYEPVPKDDVDAGGDDPLGSFTIDDIEEHDGSHPRSGIHHDNDHAEDPPSTMMMEPLELAGDDEDGEIPTDDHMSFLFSWRDPWLPAVLVTLFLVVPVLIGNVIFFYNLFGRIWVASLFAIHLWIALVVARCHLLVNENDDDSKCNGRCRPWSTSMGSLLDLVLFGIVYPMIWNGLVKGFFVDYDGTDIPEWSGETNELRLFRSVGFAIAAVRFGLGATSIMTRCNLCCRPRCLPRTLRTCVTAPWMNPQSTARTKHVAQRILVWILFFAIVLSTTAFVWCLYSAADHLLTWTAPEVSSSADCDLLDETECSFPFPSFHHMRQDDTSATGWRVALKGDVLPPLKGGISMHMEFLNELDGFPTMGPLLFYMDGLKEAHEEGLEQLQGPSSLADSVTDKSATLLVDVSTCTLVPHSAEIDYLDPNHPVVMVFPAQPLKHGTHYALAVVNAKDKFGTRLNRTKGMSQLMTSEELINSDRRVRYETVVLPALDRAADWVSATDDPESVQLLFDFMTISEDSQLGPIRAVRDGVLAQIRSPDHEWKWSDHVRTVRIDDFSCEQENDQLARTVHAEIDVPWFLSSGGRNSTLNPASLQSGRAQTIGVAKFVAHIPCSVRAGALGYVGGKTVQAYIEYGHGLFFTREEAADHYLIQLAHDEGYVLIAQDWRGMSAYDLLLVAKILMAKPRMFEAIRDNLIQGYANKLALQHFARNTMLSMPWFQFKGKRGAVSVKTAETITSIFYGVSQGGILGAGYAGLSGNTGLIDRAILTAAGTPFAMIMTRSLQFAGYDKILLTNFYNNRHVRLFLILVQMGWDSCEASGIMAPPLSESFPPTLLQAGLGDPVVPTIATEALARSLNATIFLDSPRDFIFGVPQFDSDNKIDSQAMLSELQYDSEYASLPKDDTPPMNNWIHWCIRLDPAMIRQLKEFVNSGNIINPCRNGDTCHRSDSTC